MSANKEVGPQPDETEGRNRELDDRCDRLSPWLDNDPRLSHTGSKVHGKTQDTDDAARTFTWAELLAEDPGWLCRRRRLGLSTKIALKVSTSAEEAMLWCEREQRRVRRDGYNPNTLTLEVKGTLFSAIYPRWMPTDDASWPRAWAWFHHAVYRHACRRLRLDPNVVRLDDFVGQT